MKDDIQMVDLKNQYLNIKKEIDDAIQLTLNSSRFIGGEVVNNFAVNLRTYLDTNHVIPCANGTDALQIALMALDLNRGDEVIVPAFTYVATAEVIALLGLKPIMIDVNMDDFNIKLEGLDKVITPKTKVIIPVHLYGQSSDMTPLLEFATEHNLYVIEDNAQSIGANYKTRSGDKKTGTIGHIGTYSFFPSKNLGCYGDGGAISTNDEALAKKIKMIASHGQSKKYYHEVIGVNSRLDSIQAGVLDVKLQYLNQYISSRQKVAEYYDDTLDNLDEVIIPFRNNDRSHVFHQYTLKIQNRKRDELKEHLASKGIPSMIYYPLPLYHQVAFKSYVDDNFSLSNTEQLCAEVLSIPMHTEMDDESLDYITKQIKLFFS